LLSNEQHAENHINFEIVVVEIAFSLSRTSRRERRVAAEIQRHFINNIQKNTDIPSGIFIDWLLFTGIAPILYAYALFSASHYTAKRNLTKFLPMLLQ